MAIITLNMPTRVDEHTPATHSSSISYLVPAVCTRNVR